MHTFRSRQKTSVFKILFLVIVLLLHALLCIWHSGSWRHDRKSHQVHHEGSMNAPNVMDTVWDIKPQTSTSRRANSTRLTGRGTEEDSIMSTVTVSCSSEPKNVWENLKYSWRGTASPGWKATKSLYSILWIIAEISQTGPKCWTDRQINTFIH